MSMKGKIPENFNVHSFAINWFSYVKDSREI